MHLLITGANSDLENPVRRGENEKENKQMWRPSRKYKKYLAWDLSLCLSLLVFSVQSKTKEVGRRKHAENEIRVIVRWSQKLWATPMGLDRSWSSWSWPVWRESWHVTSPIQIQSWQTVLSNTISSRKTGSCLKAQVLRCQDSVELDQNLWLENEA